MTDRELMQQALDALLWEYGWGDPKKPQLAAITALRERLAQPEQEPVAWISESENLLSWDKFYDHMKPLYTAPQPAQQPLTHPQIHELDWPDDVSFEDILLFARAVEAAHGIGEKK